MASQTDLPFRIRFIHGEGATVQYIPLDFLTSDPTQIDRNPIRVVENLPLAIEWLEGDGEILVRCDGLVSLNGNNNDHIFTISREAQRYELHKSTSQEAYPWRCGRYHFSARHGSVEYFGCFDVVPRNLSDEQLEVIHDMLKARLSGLVTDYLKFRRSTSVEMDPNSEIDAAFRLVAWCRQNADSLLRALANIELSSDMELEDQYRVERIPRRQTAKSVRWLAGSKAVGGLGGQSYLNRRMSLQPNSAVNRVVKYYLNEILLEIEESLTAIGLYHRKYLSLYGELSESLELVREHAENLKWTRVISRRDHSNAESSLKVKELNAAQISDLLRSFNLVATELESHYRSLRNVVFSSFWRSVQMVAPRRNVTGRHPAYHHVLELWDDFSERGHRTRKSKRSFGLSSVPKPTYLLYEYYLYFETIETFKAIGFHYKEDNLGKQLEESVLLGGLQEGAKVVLQREHTLIEIVYDEMVESHDELALKSGKHFFSMEMKRKPDIRIDWYTLKGDRKTYQSSVIVEVKYRPIWNIYSEQGNTETMQQMDKYYAMKYVDLVKGRKLYRRTPVNLVICAYPGSASHPVRMEEGCGVFLQYYPMELNQIVGRTELANVLRAWIHEA